MSTDVQTRQRLDFVDAQRGLAVVLMIWMHTADAWLEPSLKHGRSWDVVRSLGGLAAPTFLLLVGLSLGLGWGRSGARVGLPGALGGSAPALRGGAPSRTDLARGLQLVVLGYGLRLQMWVVDAAGYRSPGGFTGAVLLVVAYAAAYRGLGKWAAGAAYARELLIAAAAAALAWTSALAPQPPPISLLRVDVLQAIGAAIVFLALVRAPLARQPALGVVLGVAVALATPWFRSWVPGPLPIPIAAYVAQWPAAPHERVASLFPQFPWLAYPLIGSAIGAYLARAIAQGGVARAVLRLGAVGVVLALLACEPLPIASSVLRSTPALSDLSRVTYRVGIALMLGALSWAIGRGPLRAPLVTLGRTSLFVYWVHLELAFGAIASPIAHSLGFTSWLLGFALLAVVMTVLAGLWTRLRRAGPTAGDRTAERSAPGFSGA